MSSNPGNEVDINNLLKHFNMNSDGERMWVTQAKGRFKLFYEKVREQPLSSFTRAMELKCRSLSPIFNEFFNIDYVKYAGKIGLCMLFQAAERFRISIPNMADEIKSRDIVAHETGHLYNAVMALETKFSGVKNDLNYRIKHQKMCRTFLLNYLNFQNASKFTDFDNQANIIGSFILNERSIFYNDRIRITKPLSRSYEEILIALKNLK